MNTSLAERVAQSLEMLAEVWHDASCSAAGRDYAEQLRFDLLGAWGALRARETAEAAETLKEVLHRVAGAHVVWKMSRRG
jgi:hypothetical protein